MKQLSGAYVKIRKTALSSFLDQPGLGRAKMATSGGSTRSFITPIHELIDDVTEAVALKIDKHLDQKGLVICSLNTSYNWHEIRHGRTLSSV